MKYLGILSITSLVLTFAFTTDGSARDASMPWTPIENLGSGGCPDKCEGELAKLTKGLNIACSTEAECNELAINLRSEDPACSGCVISITPPGGM